MATGDYAQLSTDTDNPEVTKLLITHTIAIQATWDATTGKPAVDAYLGVFDKVYKSLATTTTSAELPEEDVQKGGQGG
jgi:hypothetical protein